MDIPVRRGVAAALMVAAFFATAALGRDRDDDDSVADGPESDQALVELMTNPTIGSITYWERPSERAYGTEMIDVPVNSQDGRLCFLVSNRTYGWGTGRYGKVGYRMLEFSQGAVCRDPDETWRRLRLRLLPLPDSSVAVDLLSGCEQRHGQHCDYKETFVYDAKTSATAEHQQYLQEERERKEAAAPHDVWLYLNQSAGWAVRAFDLPNRCAASVEAVAVSEPLKNPLIDPNFLLAICLRSRIWSVSLRLP